MVETNQDEGSGGISRNTPARDFIQERQAQVLEGILLEGGKDTFRGINEHGLEELGVDIREAIRGKVVADLGSGLGGLAKSAHVEQIPTTIYSINPALRVERHKNNEEKSTEFWLRHSYPHVTSVQLEEAQAYHDSHLSTNFAHNLSDFGDNFFDLMIDNSAVHESMIESDLLYERTIREMLRVLKPGGMILVRESVSGSIGEKGEHGESSRRARVLQSIGCRYEPKFSEKGMAIGAVIYKD
jgi:SAM-dependent methyltransferase